MALSDTLHWSCEKDNNKLKDVYCFELKKTDSERHDEGFF